MVQTFVYANTNAGDVSSYWTTYIMQIVELPPISSSKIIPLSIRKLIDNRLILFNTPKTFACC